MADERRVGGRYLLIRAVGSGGMGTVWQARDETLRREVAVKMLRLQPGVTADEHRQAVERAMREARIAARLHHPNAVQVYDVVDDADGPCLILQYVPSRSLAAVVSEDGPLAPHEAARVGTQLAAALAAAHRVGIVHRDIKPGNVLIADDGTVKITDFGVSHAFDDVTITSTGLITGTPAYLAPEMARGEESTAAADVYSLGSTLYFAVEGRAPYGEDGNQMAVLHRVASGQPEPARNAGALTGLLAAMMTADPAARPAMVEIAGRLPELHPLTADGAAPESAVTTQFRPAPARARTSRPQPVPVVPVSGSPAPAAGHRRLLLPLTAALVVVIIGVIVAIAVLRHNTSGQRVALRTPIAPTTSPASSRPSTPSTATTTEAEASADDPATDLPQAPVAPPTQPPGTPSLPSVPSTPSPPSSPATKSPKSPKAPPPSSDQLASAIVDYFQLIPGDLDASWSRLTSSFQNGRAGGRDTYDDYWHSVDRVDVDDPEGDAPRTVHAKLTYHYSDGNVVKQDTTFRLKREGGVLKIDKQS